MATSGDYRERADVISASEWDAVSQRMGVPPRQMDIIKAFIDGHRKRQDIAAALGLQVSTVKTHTKRLFENLGVHDRTAVVVLAYKEVLKLRAAAGLLTNGAAASLCRATARHGEFFPVKQLPGADDATPPTNGIVQERKTRHA